MSIKLLFVSVFCLFVAVFSKQLHIKEDMEAKVKDTKNFMNLFNEEDPRTINARYARHVYQEVTENVLDHLIKELKEQYFSERYNENSPIRRLIRNLSKEMKRNEHSKMLKERQRKKLANKTKNKNNTMPIKKEKIISTTVKKTPKPKTAYFD